MSVCHWKEMGFLDWTFPEPRWGVRSERYMSRDLQRRIFKLFQLGHFDKGFNNFSENIQIYVCFKLFALTQVSIVIVASNSPSFLGQGISPQNQFSRSIKNSSSFVFTAMFSWDLLIYRSLSTSDDVLEEFREIGRTSAGDEEVERGIFDRSKTPQGNLDRQRFIRVIRRTGLQLDDPRLDQIR